MLVLWEITGLNAFRSNRMTVQYSSMLAQKLK